MLMKQQESKINKANNQTNQLKVRNMNFQDNLQLLLASSNCTYRHRNHDIPFLHSFITKPVFFKTHPIKKHAVFFIITSCFFHFSWASLPSWGSHPSDWFLVCTQDRLNQALGMSIHRPQKMIQFAPKKMLLGSWKPFRKLDFGNLSGALLIFRWV